MKKSVAKMITALILAYTIDATGACYAASGESSSPSLASQVYLIRQVNIQGNKRLSAGDIRFALPALQEGKLLDVRKLSEQVLAANENPSRSLAVNLTPLGNGSYDATVSVKEGKFNNTFVTYDNTGTALTGRTRLTYGHVQYGLGPSGNHTAMASYTSTSNNEKVKQFYVNYRVPLPRAGDELYFAYYHSNNELNYVADIFNTRGAGEVLSLHYVHNISRSDRIKSAVDIGIERHKNTSEIKPDGMDTDLGHRVNDMPLSITYMYANRSRTDVTAFSLSQVSNIQWGSLNDDAAFNVSSGEGAKANFNLQRATALYQHRFASGWVLNTVAEGQHTREPLISMEQFGLGGAHSVRGFDERHVYGDKGYRASVELYTPAFGPKDHVRGLVFFDGGKTYSFKGTGETTTQQISSWGFGLRWNVNKTLSAAADCAYVINGTDTTPPNTRKLHFSVTAVF